MNIKITEIKSIGMESVNRANAKEIRRIADEIERGEYKNYVFYALHNDGDYSNFFGAYMSKHEYVGILMDIINDIITKNKKPV